MTDVDPDAVAAATLAAPSVARMSGGALGEVATFLPGRRVPGVRIKPDGVEVHVVARYGANLPSAADEVRKLVQPYAGDRPVSVYVDDIVLPGEETPEPPAQGQAASSGPTGSVSARGNPVVTTPLDEVAPAPTGSTSAKGSGAAT